MEEKYKRMMMEKFAEDDKIEQMNEQRRRMKREEHKRAVNLLLEERRQMRHEAKLKEAEAINERKMEEQERSNIIEEERMRILQQNIDKLVGHIPKGILSEVSSLHAKYSILRGFLSDGNSYCSTYIQR